MANCQKNTNYLILDASGNQIRDIRLSSNGKQLEIVLLPSGNVECTFDIDSSSNTGLIISGSNLLIIDAIDGLSNQASAAAGRASIQIKTNDAGALEVVGVDDIIMNMQANIRYDGTADEVLMEYA